MIVGVVTPLIGYVPGIPNQFSWVVVIAALGGIAIVMVNVIMRPVTLRNRSGYIDALLSMGRCAACGFAIGGAATESSDGCTICPECGAAWRASRVAKVTISEATNFGVRRLRSRMRLAHQHSIFARDALGRRVAIVATGMLPRGAA